MYIHVDIKKNIGPLSVSRLIHPMNSMGPHYPEIFLGSVVVEADACVREL